jgi:hypothetical protein
MYRSKSTQAPSTSLALPSTAPSIRLRMRVLSEVPAPPARRRRILFPRPCSAAASVHTKERRARPAPALFSSEHESRKQRANNPLPFHPLTNASPRNSLSLITIQTPGGCLSSPSPRRTHRYTHKTPQTLSPHAFTSQFSVYAGVWVPSYSGTLPDSLPTTQYLLSSCLPFDFRLSTVDCRLPLPPSP